MRTAAYPIVGGDYEHGGAASRALKEVLKKVGVEPQIIRRAIIAAYEAEMNVVIYAREGQLRYELDDSQLNVWVADSGPGIPDIALAMQEGYSTAPPAARELGFGAGMGLPNIKKNADWMEIQSVAGAGTKVSFSLSLRPGRPARGPLHSLLTNGSACRHCLACLRVCPTRALRIRDAGPAIIDHLCVDCGACVAACPTWALCFAADRAIPVAETLGTLVIPAAFLVQFEDRIEPSEVITALLAMGFKEVRFTEEWESALRTAMLEWASASDATRPVISPVCPAVVALIETSFPSLIANVAPFVSPIEAAAGELEGKPVHFVVPCAAQATALRRAAPLAPRTSASALLKLVAQWIGRGSAGTDFVAMQKNNHDDLLCVTGVGSVVRILEEVEEGRHGEKPALEMYACENGCFGAPEWHQSPFIARYRLRRAAARYASEKPLAASALRRKVPLHPREGIRLDSDIGQAIAKLRHIDELARRLPGRDCGACGAPTCAALAEDFVLGRTKSILHCPFAQDLPEQERNETR